MEGREDKRTSMIGVWPLIPTFSFDFVMTTSRSLPLMLAGTGTVMSTSWIVCVHLYGSCACSAASLALSSASFFARSSGVGDVDIVGWGGFLDLIGGMSFWGSVW